MTGIETRPPGGEPSILAIRRHEIDELKHLIFKDYNLPKLTATFLCFLQKTSANSHNITFCKICIYFYLISTEKIINIDFTDSICNLFVIPKYVLNPHILFVISKP